MNAYLKLIARMNYRIRVLFLKYILPKRNLFQFLHMADISYIYTFYYVLKEKSPIWVLRFILSLLCDSASKDPKRFDDDGRVFYHTSFTTFSSRLVLGTVASEWGIRSVTT